MLSIPIFIYTKSGQGAHYWKEQVLRIPKHFSLQFLDLWFCRFEFSKFIQSSAIITKLPSGNLNRAPGARGGAAARAARRWRTAAPPGRGSAVPPPERDGESRGGGG